MNYFAFRIVPFLLCYAYARFAVHRPCDPSCPQLCTELTGAEDLLNYEYESEACDCGKDEEFQEDEELCIPLPGHPDYRGPNNKQPRELLRMKSIEVKQGDETGGAAGEQDDTKNAVQDEDNSRRSEQETPEDNVEDTNVDEKKSASIDEPGKKDKDIIPDQSNHHEAKPDEDHVEELGQHQHQDLRPETVQGGEKKAKAAPTGKKDSQQDIKDSQPDLKDSQPGLKESQQDSKDSQQDSKHSKQDLKHSQLDSKDSQPDSKDSQPDKKDDTEDSDKRAHDSSNDGSAGMEENGPAAENKFQNRKDQNVKGSELNVESIDLSRDQDGQENQQHEPGMEKGQQHEPGMENGRKEDDSGPKNENNGHHQPDDQIGSNQPKSNNHHTDQNSDQAQENNFHQSPDTGSNQETSHEKKQTPIRGPGRHEDMTGPAANSAQKLMISFDPVSSVFTNIYYYWFGPSRTASNSTVP